MENEMGNNKAKVELTLDELFEMSNFSSPRFAMMIQAMIARAGFRNGFARNLLNKKMRTQEHQLIKLTLYPETDDRATHLKEQIQIAEEQTYVKEDRSFLSHIRENMKPENIIECSRKEFNIQLFTQARGIVSNAMPVNTCLFSNTFWTHFIGDAAFASVLDPVTEIEKVKIGRLGSIYGLDLWSDAFRHPSSKVLNSDEMFFFAPPEHLGEVFLNDEAVEVRVHRVREENVTHWDWELSHNFIRFGQINMDGVSLLRIRND